MAMASTALDHKNQGNEFYANKKTSEAIQSYTEAIKLLQINPDATLPLHLLYSNRAAAYIQEKDFYAGYEDAKRSLKLEKHGNFKGFYRAALCAYHLGFLPTAEALIDEAIKDHHGKSEDYSNVKEMLDKKVKCMTQYRRPQVTAKRVLKTLGKIIKNGILLNVIPAGLYQLRYLLRCYFEKKKDRKLMNIDTGDLGLRLHELAVTFNATIDVEKLLQSDPIFEDLILNEMPDVGPLRLRAFEQRSLPRDERDYDLEEAAGDDLTAYEFSFFTNNVLAYLVVEAKDPTISLRALKQLHRLTSLDLYRKSLGDALSDAMNTYIYTQSKNVALIDKLASNHAVPIFFYDYIEAACHSAAARMIGKLTVEQWKRQAPATIQFVLKQIRKKIDNEGMELVEPKKPSEFQLQLERLMNINGNAPVDRQEDLHLMVKVLSKIYLAFGKQPFTNRSMDDPFYLFVVQTSSKQLEKEEDEKKKIAYLRQTWTTIITNWLKLDYATRRSYSEPMDRDDFDDDDD